MEVLYSDDHGSTFGGNPLASAVAYEALNILDEEALAKRAEVLGGLFVDALKNKF